MVSFKFRVFILLGIALGLLAGSAVAQTSCIDYNSVGMSSCEPKSDELLPIENIPPGSVYEDTEDRKVKEDVKSETDKQVEEYLEHYDKPPREFIEFNVNPTLENAVKWAHKYQEIIERNKRLTTAWAQAQKLYKEMQTEGAELPTLDSSLPAVPDYGLALPKGYGGLSEYSSANTAPLPSSRVNGGSLFQETPVVDDENSIATTIVDTNLGSMKNGISTEYSQLSQGRITGTISGDEPILISYYFSAQCPFCKKFEPEFQQVIKELGDKLDVTCVDMSPKGADPRNIQGKVDCKWRPLLPDEMQVYGIKSTPTLIISRNEHSNLERLGGYVSGAVLKRYLLTGKK